MQIRTNYELCQEKSKRTKQLPKTTGRELKSPEQFLWITLSIQSIINAKLNGKKPKI